MGASELVHLENHDHSPHFHPASQGGWTLVVGMAWSLCLRQDGEEGAWKWSSSLVLLFSVVESEEEGEEEWLSLMTEALVATLVLGVLEKVGGCLLLLLDYPLSELEVGVAFLEKQEVLQCLQLAFP